VTVSHAKFDEVMMNFNHLVEKAALRDKCGALDTCCYYRPIGNVRTMLGENVHLTVVCKRCGKRKDVFLTKEEYFTQQKLIHKEIGDV
jgi:hypothetical protein|tara:strand:+ start:17 stop:280 length:264 start_codon:yes stop_codon:yes gene_type:complete